MKERIIVRTETKDNRFSKTSSVMEKSTCDWKLNFYLVREGKTLYLFTQNYTKDCLRLLQTRKNPQTNSGSFKNWRKNPRLDKTIEKIPIYRTYVIREIA